MTMRAILAALGVISVLALPAMAQSTGGEQNGHHYNGGPKTVVPHHMGEKETVGVSKMGTSGGHHYTGGPATGTPHHMGDR